LNTTGLQSARSQRPQNTCATAVTTHIPRNLYENFQLAMYRIKSENGECHPMPRNSTHGSMTPHAPVQMFCGVGSSVWVQLLHVCGIFSTSVCLVPQVKDLQPTVRYNCFEAHLPIISMSFTFCHSSETQNARALSGDLAANE
jgi:hypothetical protein